MFLDSLIIEHDKNIVREIKFHSGLNLIVDETPLNKSSSGNNVGKTTLLRVIDYCLGGDIERIYTDKETKTINEKVKKFLHDSRTIVTLRVGNKDQKLEIIKQFDHATLINRVDESSNTENVIAYSLFKLTSNKPSLRQILKKFIRLESNQLDYIFKFLPVFASAEDYENVFLYLFGFTDHQLLRKKTDLSNSLKKLAKQKQGIGSLKPGTLKQIIKAFDKDLKDLEKKADNYDLGDAVKVEIVHLEKIRTQISDASLELGNLNARIQLSSQTLENLKKSKTNIDPSSIKELYTQAGLLLDNVSKKFEEVLDFHNAMVGNKILFVENSLKGLEHRRERILEEIENDSKIEQNILKNVSKTGALEDLQKINNQISQIKEQRGQKTALLTELERIEEQVTSIEDSLNEIKLKINLYEEKLQENVAQFNDSYREFSKRLYNEEYILTCDNEEGMYEFGITSMHGGAIGAGKKKGQIAAFDLAYLKFLEIKNATTCRFQMNDRLEEIHLNQLKEVFSIANSIKGQFVVPILRERISGLGEEFINKHMVITLSQAEKFFKIPE